MRMRTTAAIWTGSRYKLHISSFFIFLFFNDVYLFLFILHIQQQDNAAPPLPDNRTRRPRTPTMRTRTTGRHLDGESSVGPDGGPAAIVDADEADAVIGDGALAGVAAPPPPPRRWRRSSPPRILPRTACMEDMEDFCRPAGFRIKLQ